MNKKIVPFSIVMVLSFVHAHAATSIFDEFRETLKSMEKHFDDVASRFGGSNAFKFDNQDKKVELFIDIPEGIATEKMKLEISENRSFKITLGDETNGLTVGGATDGRLLSTSIRTDLQTKEGKHSTRSSSSTQTILAKLNVKDLQAEYDEESKQLIVSIPKQDDPNNRSITVPLARRKKQ